MKWLSVLVICLGIALGNWNSLAAEEPLKVLYVTQDKGRWHDYPAQQKVFEGMAKETGWSVEIKNPSREEMVQWMTTPDYALGFDVVVYNFCLGYDPSNLDAMVNIAHQTREHGIPSVFVHGCAHSFWDTFKPPKKNKKNKGEVPETVSLAELRGAPYPPEAVAHKWLVDEWQAAHPDKPFPTWIDFMGVGSVRHGKKEPIEVKHTCHHPVTAGNPDEWTLDAPAELYNNFMVLDSVLPLAIGDQVKEDPAIVAWLHPQGKSKVLGITLGHGNAEWDNEYFQRMLIDGINYVAQHPENNEIDRAAKAAQQ